MRGRRRPIVSLVTLLTVWTSFALIDPRAPAQAAEPTLEEAVAQQKSLEQTIERQRAQLGELRSSRGSLEASLAAAQAELASISAEYEQVSALLGDVRAQITVIEQQLAELQAQIAALDAQLVEVAREIEERTAELHEREALLEEHMRDTYERSQTSLLEILLSAASLDAVTNEIGHLLTVAEQDRTLADGIREVRAELRTREATLRSGRRQAAEAREAAEEQAAALAERQAELAAMEARLGELRKAAEAQRAAQAAALNQMVTDEEEAQRLYQQNVAAHQAQEQLVADLRAEAERRARELEEARRREAQGRGGRPPSGPVTRGGFRWPMANFRITQEFGPTDFVLEPPGVWQGVYYPHFHDGIDMAGPCGTPIVASAAGVVLASGRPNPASTGYGVILGHGGDVQTWYWHLTTQVVVRPGQTVTGGQLIGYEGNTGFSTGCHLHFSINVGGEWQNPRDYLP